MNWYRVNHGTLQGSLQLLHDVRRRLQAATEQPVVQVLTYAFAGLAAILPRKRSKLPGVAPARDVNWSGCRSDSGSSCCFSLRFPLA